MFQHRCKFLFVCNLPDCQTSKGLNVSAPFRQMPLFLGLSCFTVNCLSLSCTKPVSQRVQAQVQVLFLEPHTMQGPKVCLSLCLPFLCNSSKVLPGDSKQRVEYFLEICEGFCLVQQPQLHHCSSFEKPSPDSRYYGLVYYYV